MTEPLEATLRRLKEEREAADRRYNDALSALDGARPMTPALSDPPLPLDGARLAELNAAWNIVPSEPSAPGIRGRVIGLIWRTVGPFIQRQLAFNSILVDHINRHVEAQQQARQQDEAVRRELRGFTEQVATLHSHLMVYLQQITAYVDTRDRESAGGALVLNAALSDLAGTQAKYRETLQARELRYDARTGAIAAAQEELRAMVSVSQQALAALRRHVEAAPAAAAVAQGTTASVSTPAQAQAFAPALDAYKYVGFEDQFRGSRDAIRARQESYVPFFTSSHGDVLDVGCGRGEFIELLNAHGIPARGIDLNHEMAESCRARGLDVTEADAVGYLQGLEDGSLGGIFAAQVVEHLEPSYLLRFLDLAFLKLRDGGVLVLETLNPACWTAFFESYIRDITHRWPLHPETLKYLVTASGFTRASIEFRSPVAPQDRLQTIALRAGDVSAEAAETVEAFNANVEKLNARLFTYMDYAVIGVKGGAAAASEVRPTASPS